MFPVCQPCLVLIKDYYLSLRPRLRVPASSSCVHRDRRLDLKTVSGAHSPRCFPFLKVFYFVPVFVFCLSRQASPLAASPHARRSREISATGCGYPKPAGWFSSSRVAAPPSPPLTQCPPLTHARQPPQTLVPWIQSTRHGQESRVCRLVVPTGTF